MWKSLNSPFSRRNWSWLCWQTVQSYPWIRKSFLVVVESFPALLALAQGLIEEELPVHVVPSLPDLQQTNTLLIWFIPYNVIRPLLCLSNHNENTEDYSYHSLWDQKKLVKNYKHFHIRVQQMFAKENYVSILNTKAKVLSYKVIGDFNSIGL